MRKKFNVAVLYIVLFYSGCVQLYSKPRNYDIQKYQANVNIDFEKQQLDIKESIFINGNESGIINPEFDANNLLIDSIVLNNRKIDFDYDGKLLKLKLVQRFRKSFTPHIDFYYKANSGGGLQFYPNQVYTAYNTPDWLVCDFEAVDLAAAELTFKLPGNYQMVSNGTLEKLTSISTDSVTWIWDEPVPVPPFVLGFAVGNFFTYSIKQKEMPEISLFCDSSLKQKAQPIMRDFPNIIKFFENTSGVKYPRKVYTQVLSKGEPMQELDCFSLIYEDFADEYLADSLENWLFVHELSHQWWGINMPCKGWENFWLNEAIATFITAAYKEQTFGREEYDREMAIAKWRYAKIIDQGKDRALAYRTPIDEKDAGGGIVYAKGALVLNYLRYFIEEKLFWTNFRGFSKNAFEKYTTTEDFKSAMGKHSKDLDHFFDVWVYGDKAPTIDAEYTLEGTYLIITVKCSPSAIGSSFLVEGMSSNGKLWTQISLHDTSTVAKIPNCGSVKSIRFDSKNILPIIIKYQRTPEMLIYQIENEPDTYGRADAIRQIAEKKNELNDEENGKLKEILTTLSDKDPSRLVRMLAKIVLKKL